MIKEHVENLIDDTDNLNCGKMWQLKKKIGGKKNDVPVAKMDQNGKLVTNTLELKELYRNTYMVLGSHEYSPKYISLYP